MNPNAFDGLAHQLEVDVRYADTDQMGYAHHSCAIVWFEMGRVGWMRDLGWSYRDLEARGVLMPVVRVNLQYHTPARFEDRLQVRTTLVELGRSRVAFFNEVVRLAPGAALKLSEGRVDLACVDREGRVQRLPEELRTEFAKLLAPEKQP